MIIIKNNVIKKITIHPSLRILYNNYYVQATKNKYDMELNYYENANKQTIALEC